MKFLLLLFAGVALQAFHLHFHMANPGIERRGGLRGLLTRNNVETPKEAEKKGITQIDDNEDSDDMDETSDVRKIDRLKAKLRDLKEKLRHRGDGSASHKMGESAASLDGPSAVLPQSFLDVLASFMRTQTHGGQSVKA